MLARDFPTAPLWYNFKTTAVWSDRVTDVKVNAFGVLDFFGHQGEVVGPRIITEERWPAGAVSGGPTLCFALERSSAFHERSSGWASTSSDACCR